MSRYHQTSPQSPFHPATHLLTLEYGWKNYDNSGASLIVTRGTLREECEFAGEAELAGALREHFDIVL